MVTIRKYTMREKVVSVVASVAMVGTMVAIPAGQSSQAYADESVIPTPTGEMDPSNYVTAASFRAAEPSPEILGISNIAYDSQTGWPVSESSWSAPYGLIFGTGLNSNASPRIFNTTSNKLFGTNYSNLMILETGARQGGPMASLDSYSSGAVAKSVWDAMPDIIVGNNKGVNYNSADYAVAAAIANDTPSYTTYGAAKDSDGNIVSTNTGIAYDSTNIYTMIDVMYNLAYAGNQCAADTGKILRYGDAMAIATEYEEYVRGSQGYVLEQMAEHGQTKADKKVALVNNYDATTGTYSLTATGVAEGTATANRYLEAVQYVATNLGDTKTTFTQEELADCDLIMIGGQAPGAASTDDILATFTDDMKMKSYYANGSNGACYGVVMNSVENAQNIGRILPMLYPEYLDQSDMIAYYYKHFYHISDQYLAYTISNAMDGVRNANATSTDNLTVWNESDIDDYNEAAMVNKLMSGIEYEQENQETLSAKAADLVNVTSYASEALEEYQAEQSYDAKSGLSSTVSSVSAGGSFDFTVSVASTETLASVEYTISYDPDTVAVDSITPAAGIDSGTFMAVAKDGTIKISYYNNEAATADGLDLAVVKCTAKEVVEDTDATFTVTDAVGSKAESLEEITNFKKAELDIAVKAAPVYTVSTTPYTGDWYLVTYNGAVDEGMIATYKYYAMYTLGDKYVTLVKQADVAAITNDDFATDDGTAVAVAPNADVNLNERTNIVDAQIAYDLSRGLFNTKTAVPTTKSILDADVNEDQAVTAADARAIQIYTFTGKFAEEA